MTPPKALEFNLIKGQTANRSCPLCNKKLIITGDWHNGTKHYDCGYNKINKTYGCQAKYDYMSNVDGFELSLFECTLKELNVIIIYSDINERIIIMDNTQQYDASGYTLPSFNKTKPIIIYKKLPFPSSKQLLINKVKLYLLFQ